jgi:short-subunit dehydrogenase
LSSVLNHPQTILITGASSGIGAALAVGYAAPGVTLILAARNSQRLEEVAQRCRTGGANVQIGTMDVTDKRGLAEFIKRMDDETPIDLVIANAGISSGSFAGTESLEAAEKVFAVNLGGVINTIHPLIPRMVVRGRGQIAIMSSLAGICALPGAPAYSASKAAVRVYGDALRGMLNPHHVHVSVICPGWITTPLTDKNDFPMPFIMPVERAIHIMMRHLQKKKARIAFPLTLYFLLRILATLPVSLSDFLFAQLPKK